MKINLQKFAICAGNRLRRWKVGIALFCVSLTASSMLRGEENCLDVRFQVFMFGGIEHVGSQIESAQNLRSENGGEWLPNYVEPKLYYREPDQGPRSIRVASGRLSEVFRYRGPNPLRLYGGVGETASDEVGQVELAETVEQVLLLLLPKSNGSYRVFPLSLDEEMMKTGHGLFLNLSNRLLACQVGLDPGVREVLEPGANLLVDLRGESSASVALQVASQSAESGWRLVHRERVFINRRGPSVFLIYPMDESGDHLRVLTINQNRQLSRTATEAEE
jgi:hypothetical protein